MQYVRHAKGALTAVLATAVCHTLMYAGYAWARDSATASGDTLFSGAFEFFLTSVTSWALMPVLLWAGMRLLGETGNTMFVFGGGLVWAGASGYFIDDIDSAGGHMPLLVLAAHLLLVTGLAGMGPSRRRLADQ
ncbi:hypothetical protein ACF052_04795 [Streptomyces pilosus]|uniref:hypothetical protein n=1 Tax=Streptomyces pilosus TaxID=28893 RepID=UPI0036F8ED27